MPNDVRLNEELGVIEIRAYGALTKDEVLQAISEVRRIFDERGFTKILADVTEVEAMPTFLETFELFSTFPKGFRRALLVHKSQSLIHNLAFGRAVSVNRGLPIKVFTDRQKALQWLN